MNLAISSIRKLVPRRGERKERHGVTKARSQGHSAGSVAPCKEDVASSSAALEAKREKRRRDILVLLYYAYVL